MTAKDNTGTKRPLIILTGPTAVGKTALSIGLAKAIQGEIISADSMQVYRGRDIGTAKITKEQMDGVPHHLNRHYGSLRQLSCDGISTEMQRGNGRYLCQT